MLKRFLFALTALAAVAAPISLAAPAQATSESNPPTITRFDSDSDTFYPTVRDGFKDGVEFHARARDLSDEDGDTIRQDFSIVVRNDEGRKVAEREGSQHWGIWSDWNWNGKNQSGDPVSTGKYTATFTVTNPQTGETDSAKTSVRAVTDVVTKRVTKTRSVRDTTTREARGCRIYGGYYGLHLDCVGGRYAKVTYRFGIPADATNVRWSLPWRNDGSLHIGKTSKTGKRVSKTAFVVTGLVTRYRGVYVNGVNVSYGTKVRR